MRSKWMTASRFTGVFAKNNANTIDNLTNTPGKVRNDNGMEGIYIFGFDTVVGQTLYVEAIKNLTSTGLVDGFFGDKYATALQTFRYLELRLEKPRWWCHASPAPATGGPLHAHPCSSRVGSKL